MKKSLPNQLEKERIGFWWLSQKINLEKTLFLLILLFLPTQLGRHFWPGFSYVLGIRVDYLSPTLYLTDILILSLFVFWVFRLKFKKNKYYLDQIRARKTLVMTIAMFVLFLIIGIFLSKNPMAGWYGFLKLLEFIFFGAYIAFNIKNFKQNTILTIFLIDIIFESFLSIAQFLNQSSLGGIFYLLGERSFNGQTPAIANVSLSGELILRPYGTFSHPNVLASYLLIGMIMLLYSLNHGAGKLEKSIRITSLFFATIAIFLTMGRVSIAVWVAVVVFFGIKQFFKNKKKEVYLLLAALLILGILLTPLRLRFINFNPMDETILSRVELAKDSLVMIKNQPLLGTGINNFLVELSYIEKNNHNLFYLQPVHNIYLLIASQTGIVGLGVFLWFIGKTYKRIREELRSRDRNSKVYNFKPIILSVILILGFFDHYFLTIQQGQLLLSFVFGLCWAKN
ncbi:MAG: O-antigen ligase family protein [Patescibacteria group bacterium]|nr:O-antigen ligase family protein [Patescibacteria group bacterium]